MKKVITLCLLSLLLVSTITSPVLAGDKGNGAVKDTCFDSKALWLGELTYLANNSGGHMWFTPTKTGGPYIAGHSYHNVYKYTVDDPSEWAVIPVVPDREPYNIFGKAGEKLYYKIFDTTMDVQIMP